MRSRHVAADEEVLLLGLRPHTDPGERHDLAVLAHVAAVEIAHGAALPRQPHLVAGVLEVVGVEELDGALSDQLFGVVAEDRSCARARANDGARPVDHDDELERKLEETLVDRAPGVAARCTRQGFVVVAVAQRGAVRVAALAHVNQSRLLLERSLNCDSKLDFGIGRANT